MHASPSASCFQFFLVFLCECKFSRAPRAWGPGWLSALDGVGHWMGAPCAPHAGVGAAGDGGTGRDSALPAVLGLSPLSCLPRRDPAEPRAPTQVLWCWYEGMSSVWGGWSRASAPKYDPLLGMRCWCSRLCPDLDGGWCWMCEEAVQLWERGRRGSAQGGTALGQQGRQGTASKVQECLCPALTWLRPHLAQRLCWELGPLQLRHQEPSGGQWRSSQSPSPVSQPLRK